MKFIMESLLARRRICEGCESVQRRSQKVDLFGTLFEVTISLLNLSKIVLNHNHQNRKNITVTLAIPMITGTGLPPGKFCSLKTFWNSKHTDRTNKLAPKS